MHAPTPSTRLHAVCAALALAAATLTPALGQSTPAAPAAAHFSDLLPNGREPLPGIVTGGQPTLEQLDQAAARGLRTVINLRAPGESEIGRADVEARGMTYVEIPIAGLQDLTPANAAALDAALESAESPVMVHCASGNRVGALFALRAHYLQGASTDAALRLGLEAGLTRLEQPVREILAADEQAAPAD